MKYKGFYINYIGIAPEDQFNYHFIHENEDPDDCLISGFAKSVQDAKQKINEMFQEKTA